MREQDRETRDEEGSDSAPTAPEVDDSGTVVITTYKEFIEVLRSSRVGIPSEFSGDTIVGGNLSVLDGHEHTTRRRAFNRAFRREALAWYKDHVTLPSIKHHLNDVLSHPDPDGIARADLVELMNRTLVRFAASLAGLHDATAMKEDDIDDLLRLFPPLQTAMEARFENWSPEEESEILEQGMTAKDAFIARHYGPAMETTASALDETREDERFDLLKIVAAKADPSHEDYDLGVRDPLVFLSGAIDTSTEVAVTAVAELAKWFKSHPEDFPLRTDIPFLSMVVAETVRFSGPEAPRQPDREPAFTISRVALEDITLSTGRVIRRGQPIALKLREADADPSVYGADAREFNPRRSLPKGVPAYGLGFGAGAHQCIGLPVIMGATGVEGALPQILSDLYEAGLRPDSNKSPSCRVGTLLHWESFPVEFVPLA
jgi:cytochrome P450